MTWLKRGLIFDPGVQAPWVHSHAQVPTAFEMPHCIRVFYAGRNQKGTSFITYVDVNKDDPACIEYVHNAPILPLGKTGTFDDEGMMPSEVVVDKETVYMYYSGWNRRLTSPYHNATGLLVSQDGGNSFERAFEGPVLDRIPTEPYLAVTPTVLIDDGVWKMWYVSGLSWQEIEGKFEPVYVIKHAYSSDGVSWVRPPEVCIPPKHELEAFSRPCVIKDGALYKMWFCFRESVDYRGGRGSYRLGYAESEDGFSWVRKDHLVDWMREAEAWECEMQCYPHVIDVESGRGKKRYMFYNGNGFGRSGFGYAEWQE
ncbi:MAG: hypothetical protein KJ852_15295 [Gammaproteobacteria bacterium]|jgi:hypothetical protein|nr:hypothetical protein [Gammaproteobacteria bacterium]MBU0785906.1 hypothetical protein [Gammaproteobacteria bacterium]MBU0816519.1 hypothetical protein [Gammaproteobacteria bacterium]MBU1788320.1 hypothetical protein [Gammaproteobacteria bacterium]